MRFPYAVAAAGALLSGIFSMSAPADARMADRSLKLPSAVETVACRTVRERIRRPNGAVVWRTRRVCTPDVGFYPPGPRCFTERQRIIRPNGTVVFRSVRVCR